jgi:DeoR family transcriptional regulator, aga operon transcriptional repressor
MQDISLKSRRPVVAGAGRPRLLAEERRREILDTILREGRVTVAEVAARFGTSPVTARADLDSITGSGRAVRSHGGAVRPVSPAVDAPLDVKASQHRAEKFRIGSAAADLVRPGETILLDSGTTTLEVARALLRSGRPVTVVTHALDVAAELSRSPHISLIMIGGVLRRISRSFVGPQALAMLAGLLVDHFFLGVDGLDPNAGLCTPDVLEAEINTHMIRVARQTTVVADSSKIGRTSLSVIAPIDAARRLITDTGIRPKDRSLIESRGLEVIAV